VTKTATESQRIATDKIAWKRGELEDIQCAERKVRDSRIYPEHYAPVMAMENGQPVVKNATISRAKLSVKLLRLVGFFKLLAQTRWHENQRPVRRVIVFGQLERFRNDCLHVLPQHGHVER
jgi:hypothetical protein